MFERILIANRGEIAGRIVRTARRMGIVTVAVYADPDRFSRPALDADVAVRLGPAAPRESYLDVEAIVAAARATGAQAVHPGYGFLSERADFAERLAAEGIVFIGPEPAHLRGFGLKHTAREMAAAAGVPLLPGSGLLADVGEAEAAAAAIGYPVMLKSTAGGGGIGMQLCRDRAQLRDRFAAVQRLSGASFGDARVYLERFVDRARHVEVQIFGDGLGGIVTLGERDCSLQRRNQKVVEETPAPHLPDAVRAGMRAAAAALGRAARYRSAGTVEFIYDVERQDFHFLEVNTRLQVEHPVTEAVFGVDLVEWMIRLAAGDFVLPPQDGLVPQGHAVEARLYAEDPYKDFRPSAGLLTHVAFPGDVRVDGWVETGTEVSPFYDPMLAKLIVHGADRAQALAKMQAALDATALWGFETNLDYLRAVMRDRDVLAGRLSTALLRDLAYRPRTVEFLAPGAQTMLQDWPGRLGAWAVGVPPSGPMDDLSFRLANRIVGNPPGTTALECAIQGPVLVFDCDAVIGVAGAPVALTLDGAAVPMWEPVAVAAGQVLAFGRMAGPGQRSYLAVRGGFDAPLFLGSAATFALGGFGGHATGVARAGDVLRLAPAAAALPPPAPVPSDERPALTRDWRIGVVYGPHGAPDFFTDDDIEAFFDATFEVHFNSARTGVRLVGPRPRWARTDGGEAGLHPSNIHDTPYAVGAVDYTGDLPVILGPDGPSLGGFVCPVVVGKAERWKLGQLRPGDTVHFIAEPRPHDPAAGPVLRRGGLDCGSPILARFDTGPVAVVYRRAGDDNVLVEYGPMVLDIGLRLRVHVLMEALSRSGLPGVVDLTPGIRSLQVHYDPARLSRRRLIEALTRIEAELPAVDGLKVPSRIVHLPLSWNDPAIDLAVRKYQELVRPDAPWCPSNIEFIRRINGLGDVEEVRRIVFDASYLVLGLGDVYLGAPVATPVDPRHRLVTTKYNPARTWTPQNAVGIGGAYMCIYGMEGPGGYQLFGRTIQVWNSWQRTPVFKAGKPWALRFFDQIRFFPVTRAELEEARAAFPHGRYPVRIEETVFDYGAYRAFLEAEAEGIARFKGGQARAFEAERLDWKARGLASYVAEEMAPASPADDEVPDGCAGVASQVTGNVWKILAAEGDVVAAGAVLMIVESMKMEMEVVSTAAGRLRALNASRGHMVRSGQIIAIVETETA